MKSLHLQKSLQKSYFRNKFSCLAVKKIIKIAIVGLKKLLKDVVIIHTC